MILPVKRIKNMEPAAWQLFHDLARAHGLEHAAMLKWLTEEQVRREVAAPFLDRPFGGSPTPSATPHPSKLAPPTADLRQTPPMDRQSRPSTGPSDPASYCPQPDRETPPA